VLQEATPTSLPITRPLGTALPRGVTYASLQISVTKAIISNLSPSTSPQYRQYHADQAWAYVDLAVANPLTIRGILIDSGMMQLQTSDGKSHQDISGLVDNLSQMSNKEEELVFPVPITAGWKGAKLIVAQPGKEAAVIPLDGPQLAAQYPVRLNAAGQTTAQQVTYQIVGASLDLDDNGTRADTGKRFLHIALHITDINTAAGGIALIPNDFRLLVDGAPLEPVEALIQVISPQSTTDAEVVFVLPSSVRQAVLQVGEVGHAGTAQMPITLSP
jgi:hypothetical protein